MSSGNKALTNRERAGFANVAVKAFAKRTGLGKDDDMATKISDLVGDLMHLADVHKLDWPYDIQPEAERHYYAEVKEENDVAAANDRKERGA